EFDLLCLFAENKGRAFSREHLLDRLWGWDYEGDTRTVDTHIKRLRAKLAKLPHDDWDIKTVWGVGYALEVAP
ncbi:MAG: winged helix-turn-helix domain-containing protein, partial [Schwartzia sp.]|nr:winged helix-turn-helix domain-containing protein [Schwartzia sp. (in: firmicutes)]